MGQVEFCRTHGWLALDTLNRYCKRQQAHGKAGGVGRWGSVGDRRALFRLRQRPAGSAHSPLVGGNSEGIPMNEQPRILEISAGVRRVRRRIPGVLQQDLNRPRYHPQQVFGWFPRRPTGCNRPADLYPEQYGRPTSSVPSRSEAGTRVRHLRGLHFAVSAQGRAESLRSVPYTCHRSEL